jgi:hypothetical protein
MINRTPLRDRPGEVGSTTAVAKSMINYYYGLNISTPGYIGGYFW